MKLGYTKLIHKKNSKTDLKNYRPISLLNCDLKIYTKCLANKLKPILGTCLQTHQYATPDRSATDALKLLRDIFYYLKSKHIDGYFVSLDFEKAFDTVNHGWLKKTMVKLSFSQHFVKITTSLNCNAKCEVIVNGYFTEHFCLRRGVRQGDPLSLYLFLISIEPLVSKLKNSPAVQGVRIPGGEVVTCPSYTDDITLTLEGMSSVNEAFSLLSAFQKASGLKLNLSKTQGLYCNRSMPPSSSTNIAWTNQCIRALGATIGTASNITEWEQILNKYKTTTVQLSSLPATYNAKSLLSKTKLLPTISYTACIYPLSTRLKREITETLEKYVSGNSQLIIPMRILQLPLSSGGYNVANIPLYCDLLFLKSIYTYCKHREQKTQISTQTAFTEYHIGHQLSSIYRLPFRNNFPHSLTPSPVYSYALALCKKYRFTFEQLSQGKIKKLYKLLTTPKYTVCNTNTWAPQTNWKNIHNSILSNHLKTFNYRCVWDNLTVPRKFCLNQMDSQAACTFYHACPETLIHLLIECDFSQRI